MDTAPYCFVLGVIALLGGIPLLVAGAPTARWFQRLGDDAVMSRILGAGFLAPSALVLIENPSVGTDLAGLIRLLCWFVSVKSLMFCWRPSWHTHLRQRLFANTAWRLVSALAMIAWGVIFVAAGIRIQGD